MLEKVLWRSNYIFSLSLMPEIKSSKKFPILTSRFERQVQTACSHHGPSAEWSVYLNLPLLLPLDWLFPVLDTVLSESEKKWPFQYIRSKVCQPTKPYPLKSNKSQNTICVNINSEGTLKSRIHGFLQNGSLELNLTYLKIFY